LDDTTYKKFNTTKTKTNKKQHPKKKIEDISIKIKALIDKSIQEQVHENQGKTIGTKAW
jgi:hypothetical protein